MSARKSPSIRHHPVRLLAQAALLLAGVTAIAGEGLAWPLVKKAIRMQYASVQQLSPADLAAWLARADTTRPLLLDVREAPEYQVSHLRDALNAPDLERALERLKGAPLDTPIVAYCSVGYRSSALIEKLQEAGYTRTFNLEGSIFAWANQGRPVYQDTVQVLKVHPYNATWGRLLNSELRADEEE